jgi:hypothetical protein
MLLFLAYGDGTPKYNEELKKMPQISDPGRGQQFFLNIKKELHSYS